MDEAALITGASRGIGMELARCFAKDGHNCVLVARSEDELHEIKTEFESQYDISVKVLARDLTEASAVEEIDEELRDEGIFIHSLVNNAGFANYGPFHDHEWVKEKALLELNINALTNLTYRFAQPMIEEKRGRILNVGSTNSFFPNPYLSTYNASKAYVLFFTEGIAPELAEHGINVTCLCPGATRTNFQKAAGNNAEDFFNRIPNFAWASPESVARYGYRSLNKGKVVAVHGWMNSIFTSLIKFTPRVFLRSFLTKIQ